MKKTPTDRDLPAFPDSVALGKQHQKLLNLRLEAMQPQVSELSFGYLWSWRPYIRTALARRDDVLVVLVHDSRRGESFAMPPLTCSEERGAAVISEVLGEGSIAACARVPRGMAEMLQGESGLRIEEERERADYIYPTRRLIDLPGQRLHPKRNFIRRFWAASPDARYHPIDRELASRCIDFTHRWLESHPKKDLAGLRREVAASVRMLENVQWLGLKGGAVVHKDGQIIAFALGEPLRRDTFAIRVEKADTAVPGSYQVINQEFVRHAAGGCRWVNREQDLGIDGLRRAKQSYCPHHLVDKYRITPHIS